MLRKILCLMVAVIFIISASGCATIAHGTSTTIRINSTPPGATAIVGGQTIITPSTVTLKNNQTYNIVFKKDGYEDTYFTIDRQISGWVWGNILTVYFILVGTVIDVMTGAAYKLTPTEVNVTLSPK